MNAEIIELNDSGMPGETRKVTLVAVPRVAELIAFGERYFDVVNLVHRIESADGAAITVFVRSTKAPYQEPKSRFGFGGR